MKKIIYLVDDEERILNLYDVILRKVFGNLVIKKFRLGRDALKELDVQIPNLIITDLNRPESYNEMGIGFLKAIREKSNNDEPKVFVISGGLAKYLGEVNFLADEYMTKPFDPRKFVHRVGYLLNYENLISKSNLADVENIASILDLIESINYKVYSKYGIKDFIKPHERNTLDLFDRPKNKKEFVAMLNTFSSFLDRFNIDKLKLKKKPKSGSLNYLETFCSENQIKIDPILISDLRNIKKLRNSYPTHIGANCEIYDILKKWGIENIKDYILISEIAFKKIVDFLIDLDKKV